MWKAQTVQTFFDGKYRKFFPVQDDIQAADGSAIGRSFERALQVAKDNDDDLSLSMNTIQLTDGRSESSLWLRRTQWAETFEGKDMRQLVNYTKVKAEDADEAAVSASVARV